MAPVNDLGDLSQGSTAVSRYEKLPESTPVLIVGGGPVGILTAIAFARYGLESVVVERHATRLGQPKAHVINHRSVEIFRQFGLDLGPLREVGLSPEEASAVVFASAMTGVEYGVLRTGLGGTKELAASPEMMFNVAQPLLEEYFLRAALKTGLVTYLRRHEWKSCTEDPMSKRITSTIQLHDDATTRTITSKYLIACDGANAKSRDILQIPFRTLNGAPESVLHYVSVHFSADLSHYKPALLWFILNPTGTGVFIAYNRKNSWVFTIQYDPSQTPKETFTSEFLKEQVFRGIGKSVDDYKELGITLWTTTPKIAEFYRSKSVPHAFVAGDAAHCFPPTGGLGLNTGVGDIHNLSWKINAIEKGWTSDAFLDSFTAERWVIANDNTKQSKINEENIFRLVNAIFKPGMTPEELWANESSRRDIRDAIQYQYDHFDGLNLQLGYVYGRDHVRGPSDYQMESVPGARLPHEWVDTSAGVRISTLDLVSGHEFVLLTSSNFTTERRLEISGVPVSIAQLGRDFTDPLKEWTRVVGLNGAAALLVRPDQHIVGSVTSMARVPNLLAEYWSPTKS